MGRAELKLGGLSCVAVDRLTGDAKPRRVAILCHGYGAPGTDLESLADWLFDEAPELASAWRFYFPAAPISLASSGIPGGRAWWLLNMQRLMELMEARDVLSLTRETPPGLEEARTQLAECVAAIHAREGLGWGETVLGGFSQGAMMTTDAALHAAEPPALLSLFSGALICQETWADLATKRPLPHVVMSHGQMDPVLPFEGSVLLKSLFDAAGTKVEFLPFRGYHQISGEVMSTLARRMKELSPA